MPLTGKLLVQVTFNSRSAGWSFSVSDYFAQTGLNVSADVKFNYGLNGVLRLTGDINADLTRATLPVGFEITSIASQVINLPNTTFPPGITALGFLSFGIPFDISTFTYCGLGTIASAAEPLAALSFLSTQGFTQADTTINNVRAESLLYPFETTFNAIGVPTATTYYKNADGLSDYPKYWEIADWVIPDVIGSPPSSAPIVTVVPGGINVTAGPGTTTVVVTNPGTVIPIIVAVTPGVLVFIPIVPPSNPVVTVTPLNGPVTGTPTVVTIPPTFDMTMSGGINLGGSPALQFIGNPSGIYTVVPGKAYDTLYERIPAVTSQDVKIPDPFIITSYVGE